MIPSWNNYAIVKRQGINYHKMKMKEKVAKKHDNGKEKWHMFILPKWFGDLEVIYHGKQKMQNNTIFAIQLHGMYCVCY